MQTENTKLKGVAREAQRYELTGVPTSTWYDLQNAGLAPKPIHLDRLLLLSDLARLVGRKDCTKLARTSDQRAWPRGTPLPLQRSDR